MKRLTKRVLCGLLAFLLVASFPSTVLAMEDDSAIYTLSSNSATPGSEVKISVTLAHTLTQKYEWGEFKVLFNTNALTLKSIEKGSAIPAEGVTESGYGWDTTNGDILIYSYDSGDPIDFQGEIAVLTFEVNGSATAGDYDITLARSSGGWFGTFDDDFNYIIMNPAPNVTVAAGKITVDSLTAGGCIPGGGGKPDVAWGYGGAVESSEGRYTATPMEGYVVDKVWADGVLAYDNNARSTKGSYTYSGDTPSRSLFFTFAYTGTF